jgi:hypothetical protein
LLDFPIVRFKVLDDGPGDLLLFAFGYASASMDGLMLMDSLDFTVVAPQ